MSNPPAQGWGEYHSLSASGVTNATLLAGNEYPMWVKSVAICVTTVASGETAGIQSGTTSKVAFEVSTAAQGTYSHTYSEGFELPAGEDLVTFVGGAAVISVMVEVYRKVPNNATTKS